MSERSPAEPVGEVALTENQDSRSFEEMRAVPFDQRPTTRSETVCYYTLRYAMGCGLCGLGLRIRESSHFVDLK